LGNDLEAGNALEILKNNRRISGKNGYFDREITT